MKQNGSNKKSAAKNKVIRPSYAANIKVVGVGGGGCSAVSRMRDSMDFKGIDFIAINTDVQDLDYCNAKKRIYIGKNLTKGLGTGMNPELGRQAAEENRSEIVESLKGADLVFITTGLGGGTGSGASPVIAEAAREAGALTVAVVTKPFSFEGVQRGRIAGEALTKLKEKVDTYIVVPNDRIFSIISKDTPIMKAFEVIDNVLKSAISGIAELIAMHGLVNVDFADVKATMQNTGGAVVTVGYAGGAERATNAVNAAINSPLLETSIEGARSVLFSVSGGRDLRMNEINDIAKVIVGAIDQNARIIFGAYHDKKLKVGQLKVTLIATNFNGGGVQKGAETPATSLFASTAAEIKTERAGLAGATLAATKDMKDAANDMKKEADKNAAVTKKKSNEIWDIPTFLRRNKRGDV
ncbi:MAG: cell division protein FtsZ [bacterium]|nr:cell division protein FtsZ [bacterium]